MAKRKYLDFYFKCLETGKIPYVAAKKTSGGLCSVFPRQMEIFKPLDGTTMWYWGHGGDCVWDTNAEDFTELRQTMVLFLAAMNNEL